MTDGLFITCSSTGSSQSRR